MTDEPKLLGEFLRARRELVTPELPDWRAAAATMVAHLREAVGADTGDPRFVELIGELSVTSPLFRQLRARHDVRHRRGAAVPFDHPQVGRLTLHREKLHVSDMVGMMLVVYHPEPGTADAEKLALLGSASASVPGP